MLLRNSPRQILKTRVIQQIERKIGDEMNVVISSALPGSSRSHHPALAGRTVRTLFLDGPEGHLEAILNEGVPDAPFAVLLSHPHPLGGGSLHNKVVYHAMKAINDPAFGLGWPVLRFNFRGVGRSQGVHNGQAESADVLAALHWLRTEFSLPLVAGGFSFGAAMTLTACCSVLRPAHDIHALVALGLPTEAAGRGYTYDFLSHCTLPKLFLSGSHDQFAPAYELEHIVASAAAPKHLTLLSGADHFFKGHLEKMQNHLAAWLKEQLL